MRRKKLLLNTITAIIYQVCTLIFGLIIPRLVISYYGSATNGLLSSITQFLAFFSLMEMGVGAVVKAALYKPLAQKNNEEISRVLASARHFFNKIGGMLIGYSCVLVVLFPLCIDHSLGYISTGVIVFSIAFSSVAQYMFGITSQLLVTADQKSYVQFCIGCITMALNTLVSVILIRSGASVEIMKLSASVVLLLRPILLKWYVDKNYQIDYKIQLYEEPIKQKWNGLAQHIATYILKHADTVILTFFSTLENVSIYYVYHLVTNGLQQLVEILTTGMAALLGNMYANNEKEKLFVTYSGFEWIIHTFVTMIYLIAGILILPFVKIYTSGINDANYLIPSFAVLIVLANGVYSIRLPYYTMIQAAGHFKETQNSAMIEAGLNVIISILLVSKYGLIGVAIGTLLAMLYRTCYLAWYLSNNILNRPLKHFLMHIIVDIITIIVGYCSTSMIDLTGIGYIPWIVMAVKVSVVIFVEIIVINIIFYRTTCKSGLLLIKGKRK